MLFIYKQNSFEYDSCFTLMYIFSFVSILYLLYAKPGICL